MLGHGYIQKRDGRDQINKDRCNVRIMVSKQLLIALNDFKASFGVYLKASETAIGKQLDSAVNEMMDKKEKELLSKYPIFSSVLKKLEDSDPEYGRCPVYTKEEEAFMNSKPYQEFIELATKSPFGNEKFQKDLFCRLKKWIRGTGTISPDEQKIFDSTEMTIWPSGEAFHGKGKSRAVATITYDADVYSIIEGYYGYDLADNLIQPFKERLEKLGYYYEPYDYGVWDIYKSQ